VADPLHQFVIHKWIPFEFGNIDLSFTNSSAMMFAGVAASVMLFSFGMKRKAMVPGRLQVITEMFYEMVSGLVKENIGPKGRKYFPLIFTIFMFILMGNLIGLVPYSFTYTSHIIVTEALALMIFSMVIVVGIANHGLHFFKLFVPPGCPVFIYPLLIPLEIVSYIARPMTHGLRLFANMVAGHIMLKVFAGFSVGMASAGALGFLPGLLPMAINGVLMAFELLIAFLQAYVFAILACIYLKDTVEIEH